MRARALNRRRRGVCPAGLGEHGAVGGVEVLPFGVLIFVAGVLVVANAWAVIDAKIAASAAAREAVRTYVEASPARDPATVGSLAAAAALAAHGRDPTRMTVVFSGGPLRRCARITAEVTYPVPPVAVPWISRGDSGITVAGRHSEIVDPLRSGLEGAADCVR